MINIKKCIEQIRNRTNDLNEDVSVIETITDNVSESSSKIKKIIEKALHNTEMNWVSLRELYYVMNYNQPQNILKDYYDSSIQVLEIGVEKLPLPYIVYKVEMPFLLPNRRKKWTAFRDTIGKSLNYALTDFQKKNDITPIENSSVSFVTYYSSIHRNYIHDNDNQDSRDVLNLLNSIFILDDDSLICDTHYFAKLSKKASRTVVYITDKNDFACFYNDILCEK